MTTRRAEAKKLTPASAPFRVVLPSPYVKKGRTQGKEPVMLEYHEHDAQDVIELIVNGRVDREQYEAIRDKTEDFIRKRGRARLLEVIEDIGPVDPVVLWEDTAFAFRHWDDFSRIAVVTKEKWLSAVLAALQAIFAGEVRAFTLDQCQEAWDWLTEHAIGKSGEPVCRKNRPT